MQDRRGKQWRKKEALQIGSWNTTLCFPGQVGHPTQCEITAKPTAAAERGGRHVVLYLKRTEKQGILLPYRRAYGSKLDEINGEPSRDEKGNTVETFSDADWAGDQTSSAKRRHSVMVSVNNCVVQSYSRSQKSIALSSSESEFLALTGAAAEGLHVKKIWEFLAKEETSMVAFTDSSTCLALSQSL